MPRRKSARPAARPSNNAKPPRRAEVAGSAGGKSAEAVRGKAGAPKAGRTRRQSGAGEGNTVAVKPAATLRDRVEQALNQREPIPTAAESEAVRFAISMPGLLDDVREQAFVELAGIVARKLAQHGYQLTQSEAANVAWWIVGHPDDVPDA